MSRRDGPHAGDDKGDDKKGRHHDRQLGPDWPGRIEKLEAKLKRLRGGEAEYLGAIESRSKKR